MIYKESKQKLNKDLMKIKNMLM